MEYDIGRLAKLGKRREWLKAEAKKNLEEIADEIAVARRAGLSQERIAALAKLSRVTVAKYEPDDPGSVTDQQRPTN